MASPKTMITGVVVLVVLMTAGAVLYPTLAASGATLNTSLGGGLGELLTGTFLGLIFGAAILFMVLKGLHIM